MVKASGPKTVSDGEGLSLAISATGCAEWILRYRLYGKRREHTIGPLSKWSLRDAWDEADRLRKGIARGEPPKNRTEGLGTFEGLARQWHERINKPNAPAKQEQTLALLENHVFPKIGDIPLDEIKPGDVVGVVYGMLDKGIGRSANVPELFDQLAKPSSARELSEAHGLDEKILSGILEYVSLRTDLLRITGHRFVTSCEYFPQVRFTLDLCVGAYGRNSTQLRKTLDDQSNTRRFIDRRRYGSAFEVVKNKPQTACCPA